ncbi:MAG: hypothetical protein IIB37_08395 [Gemmatimonadetes bacterium]|nr:hypothetical protein [Gemmatimonadota bacterium]
MKRELVPLADAAFRLKISYHQAWRRLLSGELNGQKIDGRWYILESDLPQRRPDGVAHFLGGG